MPAIRSGASISVTPSVTTTLAASLSSGTLQNDHILLFCASVGTSNSFSCPGFSSSTPVSGAGGAGSLQLLYKLNTGADPAGTSYIVTAANSDVFGVISCSAGYGDQSLLFDGGLNSGAILAAAGTTLTASSITQAYPGDTDLWFAFALLPTGTNTITAPGGFSQGAQVSSTIPSVTNITLSFGWLNDDTTTGATGTISGSLSSAALGGAMQVSVPGICPAWMTNARRPSPASARLSRSALRRATMLPQPTGTQFPLVTRQRGPKGDRLPWRLHRPRAFVPPGLPQGPLGQPWPVVTQQVRKPQSEVVMLSRMVRRARVILPGNVPQGPLAPEWVPPGTQKAGWRRFAPLLRRTMLRSPVLPQQSQGIPALVTRPSSSRTWNAYAQLTRPRGAGALPGQGAVAEGIPALVLPVRARRKPWALWRVMRSRISMVPIPKRTREGGAAFTAATAMTADAHVIHPSAAAFSATSRLTASALGGRFGTAALSQKSILQARPAASSFGTASFSAAATLTAAAIVIKEGHAAFTASSVLTASSTTGREVHLSAASQLTAAGTLTHLPTAALTAITSLTAAGRTAQREEEIVIVPLAIPGVNEPPLASQVISPAPVTESTVEAQISDQLYDS